MNRVREITRLNEKELAAGVPARASWHTQYSDSSYVIVTGLPYSLSEGDIATVLSQFGEVVDLRLARDSQTGKSRGFCWCAFEDQRSTILAVDNLNGANLLGRTLYVDHVDVRRVPVNRDEEPTQYAGPLPQGVEHVDDNRSSKAIEASELLTSMKNEQQEAKQRESAHSDRIRAVRERRLQRKREIREIEHKLNQEYNSKQRKLENNSNC